MELLIVRHAESMGNATGEYSSSQADSLSPRGERQAEALIESLRSWSFDQILVSPLRRARQTIAPYLAATGQQGEIWPEIAEACWHDEREPVEESWESQPASLSDEIAHLFRFRDNQAVQPVNPESFGAGLCRVHVALEKIQHPGVSQPNQRLLMVTHGHFIRETLNLMLGTRKTVRFPHDNCGLTLMAMDDRWKMRFCNRLHRMGI